MITLVREVRGARCVVALFGIFVVLIGSASFAHEASRVWRARSRNGRSSLACEGEGSRYHAVASGMRHRPRTTDGRAQRALHVQADRRGPSQGPPSVEGPETERGLGFFAKQPVKALRRTSQRRWAARASSGRGCTRLPDEPSVWPYPQGVLNEEHDRIRVLARCAWCALTKSIAAGSSAAISRRAVTPVLSAIILGSTCCCSTHG